MELKLNLNGNTSDAIVYNLTQAPVKFITKDPSTGLLKLREIKTFDTDTSLSMGSCKISPKTKKSEASSFQTDLAVRTNNFKMSFPWFSRWTDEQLAKQKKIILLVDENNIDQELLNDPKTKLSAFCFMVSTFAERFPLATICTPIKENLDNPDEPQLQVLSYSKV